MTVRAAALAAAAHSSFHLNLLEAAYIRPGARCYADRKSLSTLSNSFDNRSIFNGFLAALSLVFNYYQIFLGALYNTSAIIGLS